MAYSASTMRLVTGVPGQAFYVYRTADLKSVVDDSGYFDQAVDDYNLATGDIIAVTYGYGVAIGSDLFVATNTAGTVTTTKRT